MANGLSGSRFGVMLCNDFLPLDWLSVLFDHDHGLYVPAITFVSSHIELSHCHLVRFPPRRRKPYTSFDLSHLHNLPGTHFVVRASSSSDDVIMAVCCLLYRRLYLAGCMEIQLLSVTRKYGGVGSVKTIDNAQRPKDFTGVRLDRVFVISLPSRSRRIVPWLGGSPRSPKVQVQRRES
jgi:hypothetical protein